MRLGRSLWKIILFKLIFLFAILKLFFFPDVLHKSYDNDAARAEHVLQHLTSIDAAEALATDNRFQQERRFP